MGRGLPPRRRPRPEGCSEGRMAAGVDRHLDEMAERGAADRRNGSYRRWLMTELGEIELSVPRTRSWSALAVVRAYARRAAHIDRMILACFVLGLSTRKVAIALLPILGPDQRRHGEPGRQDLGCGGRRLPPPALEGHLSGLDARRRGAGAQDRHGRAPPPRPGGPGLEARRQKGDHRLPPGGGREEWELFLPISSAAVSKARGSR